MTPYSDSFYVFDQSLSQSNVPKRIPLNDAARADLLQDIVHPNALDKANLVELSSESSGIKLSFTSNRSYHTPTYIAFSS